MSRPTGESPGGAPTGHAPTDDFEAGFFRRGSTKRAPRVTGVSADVRRGRALSLAALATVVGASLAAAVGAIAVRASGTARRFEPTLPHRRAGVGCPQCHEATNVTSGQRDAATSPARAGGVPSATCVGCHGEHESTRAGHRAKQRAGELRCGSCHTSHADDQGVIFSSSGSFERYRGAGTTSGDSRFRPSRTTTVPLVSLRGCASCHRLGDPADAVARCVRQGAGGVSEVLEVTGCFDEHRRALDASDGGARRGVCAEQHQASRAFAWDAAQRVAFATEAPGAGSRPGAAWLAVFAMASGALAGGLALVFGQPAPHLRRGATNPAGSGRVSGGAGVVPSGPGGAHEPDEIPLVPARRVRLPRIDETRCLGCFACVDACPYDVLAIEGYVAKVVREEACCGVVLCQQRCPNGSLVIAEGGLRPDVPPLTEALESELVPGIFLAGDVTGGSLIKSAIRQGTAAVDAAAASLERRDEGRTVERAPSVDLAIIGAGPAGIAAALRARELGLSFVVYERGSVAESIRSFPRGKLVFDQPLELPTVGKLWLAESTKEELLAQWMRIVRREGVSPHVREGRQLDTIDVESASKLGHFRLRLARVTRGAGDNADADQPQEICTARRVVLAIGRRGAARTLPLAEPIPEAALSRVHYHLADARSFEGQAVVVVGLGDVAMEAALALCGQAGARVTLVHRGSSFGRGSARNVDAVKRAVASGRLRLLLETTVVAVRDGEVTLETRADTPPDAPQTLHLAIDALFVLIGHEAPRVVLERWGVLPAGRGGESA